jgi:hypothetical protein
MFSSLVHLILSLNISYPYLIEFHDFANKIQQGMKHQMGAATQAEPVQTKKWEPVRFSIWMPCENLAGFHWPTLVSTIGFSFFDYFRIRELSVFYETLNFIYKHTVNLENVQMNKNKENLQDVKLVQTRCEETYWLICIDTQIAQLLKGGINQWGCGLIWFILIFYKSS